LLRRDALPVSTKQQCQRTNALGLTESWWQWPNHLMLSTAWVFYRLIMLLTRGNFHFWVTKELILCQLLISWPRAGSGVVRIDPLRFLAGCRKRQLNHALSVLSLSLDFFWCVCCAII